MPQPPHPARHDRWGLRFSLLLLLGYIAIHVAIRLILAPAIGVDDSAENVFAQVLAPGYDIKQPPLYTWLIWLVQRITGPGMASFLVLKYALLLLTFVFFYRIAQRLFAEPRFAALTAWSILLLYQIGWNGHEGVTQTQALSTACMGTLLAFLRVAERPGPGRYAVLGAAIAAGFLSKLSFGAFVACLAAGALRQPGYRRVLLSPGLLVAAGTAVLLTSLWLWWLYEHTETLTRVFSDTLTGGGSANTAARIGKGLVSVALSGLGFLSPLLPVLILVFPAALKPARAAAAPVAVEIERLVRDMLLAGAAILALGVLFAGVTAYKERWMHPFFLAAPLYFMARVRRSDPGRGRVRALVAVFIAVAVAVIGVRAARLAVGPPLCNHCLPNVPYGALVERLRAEGFRAGTIVTPSDYTAANLRAAFPDARIHATKHPGLPLPAPGAAPGRKCLLVWPTGRPHQTFPAEALPYLGLGRDAERTLDIREIAAPWPKLWPAAPDRESTWRYVLFDGPQGDCR